MKLFFSQITIPLVITLFCCACSCSSSDDEAPPSPPVPPLPTTTLSFNKVASILYETPQNNYVMVLAHRGGFITTPENSLSAMQNSMDIGVDIVEFDVQLTQDGILVVMHDLTINRTTNGTGLVSDHTLVELKEFKLVNPNGTLSDETIPTLKEALTYSKDKMHLFIDKGEDYLDIIYQDLIETNTVDQTIVGGTLTWFEFNTRFSDISDSVNYVPRAGTGQSLDYINNFENDISPIGYFPSCDLISSNNEVFNRIKEINRWIFSTTLIGSNCSEDTFDGEVIWNWEIVQGTDGIFTDKSEELIEYLNTRGLHANE